DSIVSASIKIVAGSTTQSGSARFLTRGLDQSLEEIVTTDSDQLSVYSRDAGAQRVGDDAIHSSSLELAVTMQSSSFPLPLIANILNNRDSGLTYIGFETVDGRALHHIRTWNSFASTIDRQGLAEFSVREIWLDVQTGLPWRISFNMRAGRGSPPP